MDSAVCCFVLSLMATDVIGRSYSRGDAIDTMNFESDQDIKDRGKLQLWRMPEDFPENAEDLQHVKAIERYMNRVAYLYKKTKILLNNLRDTIHNELSQSVDALGKHVDMAVNKRIRFIRPYLRSLLRANSRSLLGNMMKRMMHRRG